MRVVTQDELQALVGTQVGVSDWVEMSQERINAFADCTGDQQFIHVDEEAAKTTPFGGTIAHGFLTLSMLSKMAYSVALSLEGIQMGINYGFDKIRFIQPVRAGKRIRARFGLAEAVQRKAGQWLLTYEVEVEIEGDAKPALLARWLTMQIVQ